MLLSADIHNKHIKSQLFNVWEMGEEHECLGLSLLVRDHNKGCDKGHLLFPLLPSWKVAQEHTLQQMQRMEHIFLC